MYDVFGTTMMWTGRRFRSPACILLAALIHFPSAAGAEPTDFKTAIERAKRATIGVLEDTQDQRTPDRPGKIAIRGTGFHLRDGYLVTARHAVERNNPSGNLTSPSDPCHDQRAQRIIRSPGW